MIKICLKQVNEKYNDGCAELIPEDNGKKILINLPALGEEGIRVYHDKRLDARCLEKISLDPIFINEILINITGWFYIHYELIIEVKEDHTYIAIINK